MKGVHQQSPAPVQNPEARFSSVRPCDHADTKPCGMNRRVAAGYLYFWNLVATFSSRKQALWRPLIPFESKRLTGRSLTRTKLFDFGRQTASISDVLVKEPTYHTVEDQIIDCMKLGQVVQSRVVLTLSSCGTASTHSLRDFGGYHEAHFHIPRVKG